MGRSRRRAFVAAVVAALPCALLLFACEAITGLSDFEKTECNGLRCQDDGGSDALISLADGDAFHADVVGTKPVQWARWRMPNYAQTTLPPGIDAAVDNVGLGYQKVNDGYQDRLTGLVWAEPMPPSAAQPKVHADAERLCAGLVGGFRLPSRIELVSLIDLTKKPTLDTTTFTATVPAVYWSSSEVRPFGQNGVYEHWAVDFNDGTVIRRDATAPAYVRCVKGRS